MNRIARFEFNLCCSFSRVSRYSLTALLGVVLLSDAVGAKVGGLENYSPKRSLNLVGDGKPFKSADLEQSEKPYDRDRGIPRGIDNLHSRFNPGAAFKSCTLLLTLA